MRRPITKLSLREQIVEQLRKDVLCGRLAEGERLSEEQLAKQFGVSRTPIREAFQQLTHEGLLQGRYNAGVMVASRTPDLIRDQVIVPIRKIVEAFALRTVYESLTDEDFRAWNEILEKMRVACENRDFPSIAEWDIEFHRFLLRRTGLPDLEAIWASLIVRIRHYFRETQLRDYDDPMTIYQEHRQLLDIFRQGDLEAAVEALTTQGIA